MEVTTMNRRALRCLLLVLIVLMATGCGYNKLQVMEEAVFKAWGDIESNLEARAKATSIQLSPKDLGNAQAMQQMLNAQGGLSSALARLMVVVERYPDLKANQNFLDLQNQLEGTENRINVARQRYNQAVEQFNGAIRKFPNSLTNSLVLHLERKEYFKAESGAQQAPKIKF
jgi:LemA protein